MNIKLYEGLEQIDEMAFQGCTSLEQIIVPSTVKVITVTVFEDCDSLEAIEFCNEMEQFVNEASLPWWYDGVLEESLRTYSDAIFQRAWMQ